MRKSGHHGNIVLFIKPSETISQARVCLALEKATRCLESYLETMRILALLLRFRNLAFNSKKEVSGMRSTLHTGPNVCSVGSLFDDKAYSY